MSANDNGDRSRCLALCDRRSACSHLRQAAGERIEDRWIYLWIRSHNLVERSPIQLGNGRVASGHDGCGTTLTGKKPISPISSPAEISATGSERDLT
jgi:hypothetical protein